MTAFESFVALRYLRPRKSEGFISVVAGFSLAGILLGVATLIVVMSVMSGVEQELTSRIIGMKSHVTVMGDRTGIENYDALASEIAAMPGVKSAIPAIEGQVMVSAHGVAQGAIVEGMRAADLDKKPLLAKHIVAGDTAAFASGDGILIGARMAERLALKPGDMLTLISPEGRATIAGVVPRIKAYPIAGIFEAGMVEYDAALVIMPFEESQIYFKYRSESESGEVARDAAAKLEVMLDNPNAAPAVAAQISGRYQNQYEAHSWQEESRSLFEGLAMQRKLMVIVLTLIIIVAAFSLISGLVMLVRSKRRDIAILRTMGATRRGILKIFLLTGSAIGILGTALGVGLGLLIAANIAAIQHWIEARVGAKLFADQLYFFTTLPSDIHAADVISVIVAALGLSFLSTLYPAWKAAKLDPAEALRYE
jgi:lipoprotein-releasing system permease protein